MSETPRKKLVCPYCRQNTDQDATCLRIVNIIQESKRRMKIELTKEFCA